MGGVVEAVEVLGEAENLAAVDPDPLEDAIAVEEAMIVHRDGGRLAVVPLAVEPDGGHTGSGGRGLLGRLEVVCGSMYGGIGYG